MKTSVMGVFCIFALVLLLTASCGSPQATETETAAPGNDLMGVWRIAEAKLFAQPEANREEVVYKNHRPGIVIFTKDYFSWVDVHEPASPDLPEEPTDAQLAAAYRQLTAQVGTYKADESTITVSIIVANDPNEMSAGKPLNLEYRFEGDLLVLTLREWGLEFKSRRVE